jgi:hypothetical protein
MPKRKTSREAGLDLGPACPGVVKTPRPASQLAKIPKDSNIFEVFNELTGNSDLSDEEAFFCMAS